MPRYSASAASSGIPDFGHENGKIFGIKPGESGFLRGQMVQLSGEIRNIRPDHHLWLFIQYGKSGRYFPSDEEPEVFETRWFGFITIQNSGPANIILADLSPDAYYSLVPVFPGESIPDLPSISGVTILDRVPITVAS